MRHTYGSRARHHTARTSDGAGGRCGATAGRQRKCHAFPYARILVSAQVVYVPVCPSVQARHSRRRRAVCCSASEPLCAGPARCEMQAECEPACTALLCLLQRLVKGNVHVRSEGAPEEAASTGIPDTLPLAGKDTDWREFRARLVASQVRGRLVLHLHPGCWEAALPEQCNSKGSRVHAADFT